MEEMRVSVQSSIHFIVHTSQVGTASQRTHTESVLLFGLTSQHRAHRTPSSHQTNNIRCFVLRQFPFFGCWDDGMPRNQSRFRLIMFIVFRNENREKFIKIAIGVKDSSETSPTERSQSSISGAPKQLNPQRTRACINASVAPFIFALRPYKLVSTDK